MGFSCDWLEMPLPIMATIVKARSARMGTEPQTHDTFAMPFELQPASPLPRSHRRPGNRQ
jgi:hypothetical protein